MVEEQKLYWGMHFCNSRMFKTVAKIEMHIQEKKAKEVKLPIYIEEHIQYCMTEQGQIFKMDKTTFYSYELDLQKMVWFQNQDFIDIYFGDYMKYTTMDDFIDYYEYR